MPGFDPATLGMQAAGQVIGAGMGLALQPIQDKRQLKQQAKLQKLQIQGQKEMTDYNTQKQLEMWQNTSYAAQKEQMIKAGLNPGLMYGMGGGGGQTASIAQGSVQGGHAPAGGGEIGMGMQMMMQARMMQAQIDNLNADTDLKKTNVPKTEAETDLVRQNIKNAASQQQYTEAMTAWQNIETKFASESYENRQKQISSQLEQTIETVKQIGLANNFTRETWNAAVSQIEKNVIQTQLHNELLEVQKRSAEKGIQLQQAEIDKMSADIAQGWAKIRLEGLQGQRESVKLEQTNLDLLLKQIQTEFNISHPGVWNVIGGTVEQTIRKTAEDIYSKMKNLIPKL